MKIRNRLDFAILASILLHFMLIGLLMLGSLFTPTITAAAGGNEGEYDSIEAVMVDTGQVAIEYGRLKAEQSELKPQEEIPKNEPEPTPEEVAQVQEKAIALAREQQLAEQKAQEQKRQAELARQEQIKKQQEETRKKELESARLQAEAEAKRLEAAAKKAEEERKAKEIAKQKEIEKQRELEKQKLLEQLKAEQEAKAKAEQLAKEKAEKLAKERAEREAKAKAEREAKEKEERAKRNKALDDFLNSGDLSSSKGGNKNTGSQGSGGKVGAGSGTNPDGSRYLDQISRLLKSRFKNAIGQSCYVRIFLERDGTISNYQVIRGPTDVCEAAQRAVVSTRKVPAAPSDDIYQQYRSPTIEFRP